jgi:hypothetical protein
VTTLDQTQVLAALAAIAKAAPDLRPVYHCDGGELDFEVPHQGAATDITHLLARNRGRGWAA